MNDLALIGSRHEEDQSRIDVLENQGDIGLGARTGLRKNLSAADRDGRAYAFVLQAEPGGDIVLLQPIAKNRMPPGGKFQHSRQDEQYRPHHQTFHARSAQV